MVKMVGGLSSGRVGEQAAAKRVPLWLTPPTVFKIVRCSLQFNCTYMYIRNVHISWILSLDTL